MHPHPNISLSVYHLLNTKKLPRLLNPKKLPRFWKLHPHPNISVSVYHLLNPQKLPQFWLLNPKKLPRFRLLHPHPNISVSVYHLLKTKKLPRFWLLNPKKLPRFWILQPHHVCQSANYDNQTHCIRNSEKLFYFFNIDLTNSFSRIISTLQIFFRLTNSMIIESDVSSLNESVHISLRRRLVWLGIIVNNEHYRSMVVKFFSFPFYNVLSAPLNVLHEGFVCLIISRVMCIIM